MNHGLSAAVCSRGHFFQPTAFHTRENRLPERPEGAARPGAGRGSLRYDQREGTARTREGMGCRHDQREAVRPEGTARPGTSAVKPTPFPPCPQYSPPCSPPCRRERPVSLPRLPQALNIQSATRQLETFQCETIGALPHTVCRSVEKTLFFPSVLTGRRSASAQHFAFFKGKMLQSAFGEGLGFPFPPARRRPHSSRD